MRIAICGHGRHGKTTAACRLATLTGLRYIRSTSEAAAEIVFAKLGPLLGYDTVEEAWKDRHAHRREWANIIWDYNQPHGITLYEDMLCDTDIFDGIRRNAELQECRRRGIVDVAVWIDAHHRLDGQLDASCEILPSHCDITIDNNGSLEAFWGRLKGFVADYVLPAARYAECSGLDSGQTLIVQERANDAVQLRIRTFGCDLSENDETITIGPLDRARIAEVIQPRPSAGGTPIPPDTEARLRQLPK